jgi:SulP family sulfate permease
LKWNLLSFRRDIYGGLTAAVVAIPLALAFRVASAHGSTAELFGAIFVGFFSALPGGTPSKISGPTRPMTMVMASLKPQSPSRCVGYSCESRCR